MNHKDQVLTGQNVTLFFDMDGTLLDTSDGISSSIRHALSVLGHNVAPDNDFRHLVGPPMEVVMAAILKPYGDDRIDLAVRHYRDHYGQVGLHQSIPYPGIVTLLEELKVSGFALVVVTSKRVLFAEQMITNTGLGQYFRAIYGSVPDGSLDVKSALLERAVHLEPKRKLSAMIGDRREDIVAAHNQNISAVGVLWGYGTMSELTDVGADYLVETPGDLPRVIAPPSRLYQKRLDGGTPFNSNANAVKAPN